MKHNLENLPEVSIDKVDAFYVTGTQHRDAAGKTNNLKLNLKTLGGGIDLTDKAALRVLWNALQNALEVVITEADVEEQANDGFVSYKVLNTEGFPDETWADEELYNFRPKVVGVFRDTGGAEEYQVSIKLDYQEREDCWTAHDNNSGCTINLALEPDASWWLSVIGNLL